MDEGYSVASYHAGMEQVIVHLFKNNLLVVKFSGYVQQMHLEWVYIKTIYDK